nr:hypothetical protein [Tanacetum cinerariifolium]
MENYKNVSQVIRNQLDAEAEAVKIIITRIDNDIYSIVDACPNTCEVWKAIERLKQGKSINVQDLKTNFYWEFRKFTSRDGESLELYYSRSQQAATRKKGKAIVNSSPPTYDQEPKMVAEDDEIETGYDNQRVVNVDGVRENVEKAGIQLSAKQADWRDGTNYEPDDQKLKAHYLYMSKIQEVTPDVVDNFGPIFDTEPFQKEEYDNDNYNVFANNREHPEHPESVNDTYLEEQGDTNITIDSLDMSTNGERVDQDDDDLAKERDLLAFLTGKLKCEIDNNKNRNKFLESSNKTLIDNLKHEIKDFKTKNKSLESSNNHSKEANNELSNTNQLMFKDLKKFQAELDRYHDVNYALKVEIDCAKAKGD